MNRLMRFFSSGDQEFYRLFNEAGENLLHSAQLLQKLLHAPSSDRPALIKQITACETKGDKLAQAIYRRLNETFVTPFEREDIYELASTLDDIVDLIETTSEYVTIYHLGRIRSHAIKQGDLIVAASEEISQALIKLNRFKEIPPHLAAVKKHEHTGDKLRLTAVADLFQSEADIKKLVAWKDVYESLENTLNAAERHTNILKGIVIQNS